MGTISNLNREAYLEAREILESSIDFVEFYDNHADSGSSLEDTALVPCVIHAESLASFKYFPDTESFYCFGCGAGGSVVDFYYHLVKRNFPGMTKQKAVIELSRMYNLKIPDIYDTSYVDESRVFKDLDGEARSIGDVGMSEVFIREHLDSEIENLRDSDFERYLDMIYLVDTIDLVRSEGKKDMYEKVLRMLG